MLSVSVIIPFQVENDYLRETLTHLNSLDYDALEVVLVSDNEPDLDALPKTNLKITAHTSGPVGPAWKRNMGAKASKADILAFIDDDAYPDSRWLEFALPHFKNDNVTGVGGPQITPESDGFWQKVSGAFFISVLNGGARIRYWPSGKTREVDDWPTVNLLVRREDFLEIGGFDTDFYPGEDTKLCLALTADLGKKIIYEPRALVHHHRRAGFYRHLKQVGRYGLHRGYFAKRFPGNSLRLLYLIPSMFFIFVCFGWLAIFVPNGIWLYLIGWALYASALLAAMASVVTKVKNLGIALATIPYTFGSHFFYGLRFLQGVFTRDLHSKLGR